MGGVSDSIQHLSASRHFSLLSAVCPLTRPLPSPGEISTRATLDRELQSSYQLLVAVQDGGSPSRSATGTVFVTVLDDNDNDPAFTQSQSGKALIVQVKTRSTGGWRIKACI